MNGVNNNDTPKYFEQGQGYDPSFRYSSPYQSYTPSFSYYPQTPHYTHGYPSHYGSTNPHPHAPSIPPWLLYYLTQERATPTLIDKVHQAVNGEYNAISCYEKMIQLAPTKMEKEIITEIRQDEYKHYQTFSTIYTNLTGQQPKPQLDEPCPPTYEEALKFAIEDEQHTVDFYMEIGDQAQNPHIKEVFYRAAKDEQNHAVWFLYFYTRRVG